jgi:hypothetical protein
VELEDVMEVYYNAVQLGVWWSAWTLADTYLIEYTPTPEIVIFCVCICLYCAPIVFARVKTCGLNGRQKLGESLDRM